MGTGQSKEEQLYQAAQLGTHQLVKSLRRDGASLEWVDKEGRTPLILACTHGELFDMVITLLNLGANLNAYRPGAHGGFPLHHAAKRGLDKTVLLLLTRGADPLAVNDDGQTSLDVARLKGHLTIVHLIEDHISFFSGFLREVSGPRFLEILAPQWVTKKIRAVVLPAESNNSRRPPRHELAIYQSAKVPQPRIVISLAKADVDEPNFTLPDPMLFITDRCTKSKYKFLSENEGDKRQLQMFYRACKGVPMFKGGAPAEHAMQGSPVVAVQPPVPHNAGQGAEVIPEDVALAMALSASLQSASRVASTVSTQGNLAEHQGWADLPEASCNGWGSLEAGPSTLQVPMDTHLNVSGGASTASSVLPPQVKLPHTHSGSQAISAASDTPPSAPPLPPEYGPIHYPSIDTSPVELNCSPADSSKQSPSIKEKSEDKAGGVCVICWDSPAEAICIPCGHLAGCMECLSEIKSKQWGCPVCRTSIDQVVKVYVV
ncbi:hypothetical protein O6H91_12G009500 [Diphasiastrum complanatum]|uniref:Uncharacterized protein n=1 Tax=Diphasiastrum complanatum TaxID=34168 RepID=A0ACC2BYT0_DIPCM|nr:hypothetical protein O6H91_12G009500 [Diphasiastrum complanatum]